MHGQNHIKSDGLTTKVRILFLSNQKQKAIRDIVVQCDRVAYLGDRRYRTPAVWTMAHCGICNQYCVEQRFSSEANSSSASQELPRNSPPLVPILNHMNPIHALPTDFFEINFNIILPSMSVFKVASFPQVSPNIPVWTSAFPVHATCSVHIIPHLITRTIFRGQHKSLTSSLSNFPVRVTSSLLRPNISLSTHFSSWAHNYYTLHIFWGVTPFRLANNRYNAQTFRKSIMPSSSGSSSSRRIITRLCCAFVKANVKSESRFVIVNTTKVQDGASGQTYASAHLTQPRSPWYPWTRSWVEAILHISMDINKVTTFKMMHK